MVFEDKVNPVTNASISLYDSNSFDYSNTNGAILTFNANSAIAIRDPKTNFFTQIEEMIRSVEEGKKHSDGSDNIDPRNLGIQNSIQMMDDLSDHVSRLQTEAGSYSQVLQLSSDRTDMLILSTKTLQSDVIDTDIAEATLRMQQLNLNYQAMLSSISKVSQLSLVNYL
jgi:flagellar hook-associated protein 3 FlgL